MVHQCVSNKSMVLKMSMLLIRACTWFIQMLQCCQSCLRHVAMLPKVSTYETSTYTSN
jgi:hypothetical protein